MKNRLLDTVVIAVIVLGVCILLTLFFYYLWQLIIICSTLVIQFDQTPDGLFSYWRINF